MYTSTAPARIDQVNGRDRSRAAAGWRGVTYANPTNARHHVVREPAGSPVRDAISVREKSSVLQRPAQGAKRRLYAPTNDSRDPCPDLFLQLSQYRDARVHIQRQADRLRRCRGNPDE